MVNDPFVAFSLPSLGRLGPSTLVPHKKRVNKLAEPVSGSKLFSNRFPCNIAPVNLCLLQNKGFDLGQVFHDDTNGSEESFECTDFASFISSSDCEIRNLNSWDRPPSTNPFLTSPSNMDAFTFIVSTPHYNHANASLIFQSEFVHQLILLCQGVQSPISSISGCMIPSLSYSTLLTAAEPFISQSNNFSWLIRFAEKKDLPSYSFTVDAAAEAVSAFLSLIRKNLMIVSEAPEAKYILGLHRTVSPIMSLTRSIKNALESSFIESNSSTDVLSRMYENLVQAELIGKRTDFSALLPIFLATLKPWMAFIDAHLCLSTLESAIEEFLNSSGESIMFPTFIPQELMQEIKIVGDWCQLLRSKSNLSNSPISPTSHGLLIREKGNGRLSTKNHVQIQTQIWNNQKRKLILEALFSKRQKRLQLIETQIHRSQIIAKMEKSRKQHLKDLDERKAALKQDIESHLASVAEFKESQRETEVEEEIRNNQELSLAELQYSQRVVAEKQIMMDDFNFRMRALDSFSRRLHWRLERLKLSMERQQSIEEISWENQSLPKTSELSTTMSDGNFEFVEARSLASTNDEVLVSQVDVISTGVQEPPSQSLSPTKCQFEESPSIDLIEAFKSSCDGVFLQDVSNHQIEDCNLFQDAVSSKEFSDSSHHCELRSDSHQSSFESADIDEVLPIAAKHNTIQSIPNELDSTKVQSQPSLEMKTTIYEQRKTSSASKLTEFVEFDFLLNPNPVDVISTVQGDLFSLEAFDNEEFMNSKIPLVERLFKSVFDLWKNQIRLVKQANILAAFPDSPELLTSRDLRWHIGLFRDIFLLQDSTLLISLVDAHSNNFEKLVLSEFLRSDYGEVVTLDLECGSRNLFATYVNESFPFFFDSTIPAYERIFCHLMRALVLQHNYAKVVGRSFETMVFLNLYLQYCFYLVEKFTFKIKQLMVNFESKKESEVLDMAEIYQIHETSIIGLEAELGDEQVLNLFDYFDSDQFGAEIRELLQNRPDLSLFLDPANYYSKK